MNTLGETSLFLPIPLLGLYARDTMDQGIFLLKTFPDICDRYWNRENEASGSCHPLAVAAPLQFPPELSLLHLSSRAQDSPLPNAVHRCDDR